MGKLTALSFKAATRPGTYQDGEGLMLVVRSATSRSWLVRIQVDGKRRDFGVGSASKVSLADARKKASDLRSMYQSGVDPVAKKRADKQARIEIPTFRDAAQTVRNEQQGGWRNLKHRADWLSSLKRLTFAEIGNVRVDQIDVPMIRELLLPIWLKTPETARRVRQRIKAVLDWAAAKGFRPTLDLSSLNKGLPRQPKSDNHFAAMSHEKLPAFVNAVAAADETIGRLALLFTIYTAARSGETRGATWAELDLSAKLWTIPGERMKAGKEHVVALSEPALSILAKFKALDTGKEGAPIFAGKKGGPISDMTMSKVLRDMAEPFTVHGFRSTFKDWASECTGFPDAVSEAALAHIDTNRTRKAYRRTDFLKMRVDLMTAWANFIDGAGGVVRDITDAKKAA